MKEIKNSELHPILLEEAMEFHKICVKNHIPYWMLGGTQLGAVRHGGFIPWDDDMDFGVMTEDWERLIACLDSELPSHLRCRTIKNYTGLLGATLKIENIKTIINPEKTIAQRDNIGINIDIFPMVRTNEHKNVLSKNWLAARLIQLQYLRFRNNYQDISDRIICYIVKLFGFWLRKGGITSFVYKYLLNNKGNYIVNFWGRWTLKEIIHKDIMGTPTLQAFEKTNFYGVANTDSYLKSLYGDYMKMPPKDKMNLHIHGMYWID